MTSPTCSHPRSDRAGTRPGARALNEALHSRKVIGRAIGIVMPRYQLSEDRAFSFLVRAFSHGNIQLRGVAAELDHPIDYPVIPQRGPAGLRTEAGALSPVSSEKW